MTIRELAKNTGLSTGTICKALKSPLSVKESTYQKLAPFLVQTNCQTLTEVHIIVPELYNNFYPHMLSGAMELLFEKGLAPIVHLTREDAKREKEIFSQIPNRPNVGVIWVPAILKNGEPPFFNKKFRLVLAGRDVASSKINLKVLLDNSQIMSTATQLLIEGGAKFPMFFSGFMKNALSIEREIAFEKTAQKLLSPDSFHVLKINSTSDSVIYNNLVETLDKYPIDGVITSTQYLTQIFLEACYIKNISIPDDISLIAFDYIPWLKYRAVPISMVDTFSYELGQKTVELLFNDEVLQSGLVYKIYGNLYLLGSEKK